HKYEFFRGDSFQVYVKSPADALSLLLQMRIAAMKLPAETSMPVADIRGSIGIGVVKPPIKDLRTASDEAFILSGRSFDKMKPGQRLTITCNEKNSTVNLGLGVLAQFIDYLFQRLTTRQASVVAELLMKRTQTETARKLKKSQATIHKHIQSAGWPEVEKLLTDYQLLINSIEP
ncbi:MAG TPA: hypothetical protein VEV15_08025, partial [Flavisolibacter sp.]|nr:hypothetical protein [Flavisolibacter sp.]